MYPNTKKAIILAIILIIPTVSFAKNHKPISKETENVCLAKALYYEARGEPELGKKAVAKIVLNRKNHKKFPKTICKVINQVNYIKGRKLCQFSWVCDRQRIDTASNSWEQAKFLSSSILSNKTKLPNFASNVLFFKSVHSKQRFGKGYRFVSRVGKSNFYSKNIS